MVRFSLTKALWFWTMGVCAVVFGPSAISLETAALGVVLGLGGFLFGHTIGLHRGVIHRSFRMSAGLRGALTYLFVFIGLGGPLSWMRVHAQRDRWQNAEDAPAWFRYDHGILQDFWWNLHTVYLEPDADDLQPRDRNDRWLRFLQRTWALHVIGHFALLYALLGWDHLIISGFARVFIGLLGHWYVGYEAHKHGEERYEIHGACETGRNRWLLGLLSLGEGFHNNHHAFPESAQIGQRWYEIDAGWMVIRVLRAMGLVWGVQTFQTQSPRGEHTGNSRDNKAA